MARREETTDSGLVVVREEEEAVVEKIAKALPRVFGRSTKASGIEKITELRMETPHKLDPDARKSRREDNKTMKRSREFHRGAKKHGRNR